MNFLPSVTLVYSEFDAFALNFTGVGVMLIL